MRQLLILPPLLIVLILPVYAQVDYYNLLFEDAENDWVQVPQNNCGSGSETDIGDFTGADNNAGDYLWCSSSDTSPDISYEGTYGILLEGWGSFDVDLGIDFNFNPSTSCGGTYCDYITVSYWLMESGVDGGEFLRISEQNSTHTPTTLRQHSPAINSFTFFEDNITSAYVNETSVTIKLSGQFGNTGDEWFIDNFNVSGHKFASAGGDSCPTSPLTSDVTIDCSDECDLTGLNANEFNIFTKGVGFIKTILSSMLNLNTLVIEKSCQLRGE